MLNNRFKRSLICALSVLVIYLPADADELVPKQDPTDANIIDNNIDATVAAIKQVREALDQWKQSIEAGTKVSDDELARLKAEIELLVREARWIAAQRAKKQVSKSVKSAESFGRNTQKMTQAWVEQMHALGPGAAEKRSATLEQLRSGLVGDDGYQQYAALKTLAAISDVKYDKASFRPLILPIVESAESNPLVAACYALYNTKREPGDLALVEAAWQRRSEPVERSISHLLFLFSDGEIAGRSEEIILEVLSSADKGVRREGLRGLWGATVSDELAQAIVELADNTDSHHDAIYFGLSTLKVKNAAVVDKLIETLQDSDWNNWGRALWGLGYGVPPESQLKVADALAEMYVARSDPRTREKCRKLILRYAGEDALEKLPN